MASLHKNADEMSVLLDHGMDPNELAEDDDNTIYDVFMENPRVFQLPVLASEQALDSYVP